MSITSDWHIHTKFSCDSACMEFEDLVKDAKELGITDFGVTDHFHTRVQEEDIKASRKEFDKTLEKHPELKGHFHFGVEATIVSKWETEKIARGEHGDDIIIGIRTGGPKNAPLTFDFNEEFLEKYNIEYVVAGMHWPMYCDTDWNSVIKEYHRQYMFAATHPYTTIMAHYLWWDEGLFRRVWNMPDYENPFADFSLIPSSMKNELKAALLENNVAFELNGWLFSNEHPKKFIDPYLSFVSELQSAGVKISMGSDSHSPKLSTICDYTKIDEICKSYGIKSSEFFCL